MCGDGRRAGHGLAGARRSWRNTIGRDASTGSVAGKTTGSVSIPATRRPVTVTSLEHAGDDARRNPATALACLRSAGPEP
ncbi:hypothetical protein [Actinoplanes awajinensis]|uniref:Uncharacterized protein n=1 Tax=Actinoplanes awajinensis subsp. mycoplanecinus TaxID=135947 RepID=A0A101JEM0_9ACTN|nr:hypothetical protein [Actinoplanes awajinensis]KUL25334.1 hypothetical protein ADL15_41180 [Actinoplanes awajinensis subsp. mycoplanecinus]